MTLTLKQASRRLEQLCQAEHLNVFEHHNGVGRVVIPVLTEHVHTALDDGPAEQYEFFRARATHAHALNADFHICHNQVSVTVCHVTQTVKFGPGGQLIMGRRGIGLGPSLMATVIKWLHSKKIPTYSIEPGDLSRVDATTEGERLQRNRFYTAFGFSLWTTFTSESGLDVVDGHFGAVNVGCLTVPDRYQNRLRTWQAFENALGDERLEGVKNLAELKDIDRWISGKAWLSRLLLNFLKWPLPFRTRHKHPLKPWEVTPENTMTENLSVKQ